MKIKLVFVIVVLSLICSSCGKSNIDDTEWVEMRNSFLKATDFLESSEDIYGVLNSVDENSINECLSKIEYALKTWDKTDESNKYGMINFYKKSLTQFKELLNVLDASSPEARLNRVAAVDKMTIEFIEQYYEIYQSLLGYREMTIANY